MCVLNVSVDARNYMFYILCVLQFSEVEILHNPSVTDPSDSHLLVFTRLASSQNLSVDETRNFLPPNKTWQSDEMSLLWLH